MKTKKEIKQYAKGIAEGHFYCDDECKIAWEPFEYWDNAELKNECKLLAKQIENAMLWAQGGQP